MAGQGANEGTKLGVVYEPDSIPILVLAAAVRGRWPLVWILRQRLDSQEFARLRRFGECIHLADVPLPAAAKRLRDLGLGGITTFADEGLLYTSEMATALGLPANSRHTAIRLIDKLEQRSALAAAGMPTPLFCRIDTELSEDALRLATEAIPYPAVVKPAVGTGGRDTVAVESFDQLFGELRRRWSAGDRRTLIVEHCLGSWPPRVIDGYGDYLSAEVVVVAGEPQVLAVTGRMPLASPFRETGMFAPNNLTAAEDEAVRATATKAARALGVEVGCLHVEIKRTPEGPRVIEVNGRVAGGGIPDLVLDSSGDNLHAAAATAAMGESVERVGKSSGSVSYSFALQPPVGKPSRLVDDWRAKLDAIPGIRHVEVRADSVTVQPADGSYGYMLMVYGEAADHETMRALHSQMAALIEPAPAH